MAIQGLVNSNTGRAASFEEEAKQAVTGGSGGSAAKWEASSESAMIALSDATPGDVCLRTDEGLFRKLKAGGTYSNASDWRQVILANEDDELVGPIINRTGTDAELTGVVLNEGEWAYATDTEDIKIGDGSTAWENLIFNLPGVITNSAGSDTNRGTALYNALDGKTNGTVFVVGGLDYALPNDVTLEGTTNLIVIGAERGFRANLTGNAVVLDTLGVCRGFDWTNSTNNTSFKDGSMPVVFSQGGFDTTKAGTIACCTSGDYIWNPSGWDNYECAYDVDTCTIGRYFCKGATMSGDIYGNCTIDTSFCGTGGEMSGNIYGNCTIGSHCCDMGTMSGNIYGNCKISWDLCSNGEMSGNIYGNCEIDGLCTYGEISGNIYGNCTIGGLNSITMSGNIYNSVFTGVTGDTASDLIGYLSGGAYYNCVDSNGVIFSSASHNNFILTSGNNSVANDAQTTIQPFHDDTSHSGATWQDIFVDGDSEKRAVQTDSCMTVEALVSGVTADAAKTFSYKIQASVKNVDGTTTINAQSLTTIHSDDSDFDCQLAVDSDELKIQVQDSTSGGDSVYWSVSWIDTEAVQA